MSLKQLQSPATSSVMARRLRVPAVLMYGTLLFLWGFAISAAHDFGMTDESWFLQVARRVAAGEVLYRDVFFGATPLSVYVTAPFVDLLGAEILVTKALLTMYFVATVLLAIHIARQLGVASRPSLLLLLVLLANFWPRQSAGYNPLATTLLLASWSITLQWLADKHAHRIEQRLGSYRRLVWAGSLAGLCFGAKQNVGVYALGAVMASVILVEFGRWRRSLPRSLLAVVLPFTLMAGLVLTPIIVSGGLEHFVDYGFTNKTTYLQVGGFSYWTGLRELPVRVRSIDSVVAAQDAYLQFLFVVLPLLLALLLAAAARTAGTERRRAGVVLVFVAATLLGVYPRPDVEHLIYAVPGLAIGAVYASSQLGRRPRLRTALRGALLVWALLGVGLLLTSTISRGVSSRHEVSHLPHFRGVLIAREEQANLRRYAHALAASTDGQPIFLLSRYAAFFYLISEVDNPTPFDYPLVTAFGRTGQTTIMQAIDEGRLTAVCVPTRGAASLRPARLETWIKDRMQMDHPVGFCTIFRR